MKLSYPKFLRWAGRLIVSASKRWNIFGILACHVFFGFFYIGLPMLLFWLAGFSPIVETPAKIAAAISMVFVSLPVFPVLFLTTSLFADSVLTLLRVYRWLSISPYALRNAVERWSFGAKA
jgi:hypothetical protein